LRDFRHNIPLQEDNKGWKHVEKELTHRMENGLLISSKDGGIEKTT